ncbi:MAG: hypothetical protein LBQ89_08100 [Treponema sp.]|nr:hypothetical protein [Treponema sp.]
MQTVAIKTNNEFHELVDALAERKMYGEVVFYIQAGNIESCRISERYTKSEIKAMLEEHRKSKPRVLSPVAKRESASGNL